MSILMGARGGYKGGTCAFTIPVFTDDVTLPISLNAVIQNTIRSPCWYPYVLVRTDIGILQKLREAVPGQ